MDSDNLMCFWKESWTKAAQRSPFSELEAMFSLAKWQQFPNAGGLNDLLAQQAVKSSVSFVCQTKLDQNSVATQTNPYYELIIAQQQQVPTRPNSWHDLFNGLVWLQFPETKRLLNQWHVEDITDFGLTPRTIRRNNLTHFDECGVVLAVNERNQHILDLLAKHQWHEAFVVNRHAWGNQLETFVFGHANYEMLLDPFIGLTGKWLAIRVDDDFFNLDLHEKRQLLDQKLVNQLSQSNIMQLKRSLLPLPLLGIPGWYNDNQHSEFYQNTDYFRPLKRSKKVKLTQQTREYKTPQMELRR